MKFVLKSVHQIQEKDVYLSGGHELLMLHLSMTAIRKVRDGMVLATDVTKAGDVYFKLAKYILRVKPTLFFIKRKRLVFSCFRYSQSSFVISCLSKIIYPTLSEIVKISLETMLVSTSALIFCRETEKKIQMVNRHNDETY